MIKPTLCFLLIFVRVWLGFAADKKFISEALASHNKYRKMHHVPPLELDQKLCNTAQSYAERLANNLASGHSYTPDVGENIYWQSPNPPTGEDVTKSWYSEIEKYNFNNPESSSGANHFTQVVWKSTKKVGFGIARGSSGRVYVVAQYFPAGNWIGDYQKNVIRPHKRRYLFDLGNDDDDEEEMSERSFGFEDDDNSY